MGGGVGKTKRLNISQAVYVYLNNPGVAKESTLFTVPILRYSLNSAAYPLTVRVLIGQKKGGAIRNDRQLRRNKISIRLCYKITSKQFICFNLQGKATTWGLCLRPPLYHHTVCIMNNFHSIRGSQQR